MGLLASLACGIVGSYVVVKRIVFISGGISHSTLAGLGIAYYLGYHPVLGAILSSIVAALLIGFISLKTKQREDTIIGAIWSIGMAIGLIFISLTPGYNTDLMSYLFGNILMSSTTDIYIVLILDLSIIGLVYCFFKPFLAISFDDEYARVQGVNVELFYMILLCLISLTIVVLIQVVGIILVIALLTIPAAIANQFLNSLGKMMCVAVIIGAVFNFIGMYLSYQYDMPAGASIILVAGCVFIATMVWKQNPVKLKPR